MNGFSSLECSCLQCYDKFMIGSLRACAEHVGKPKWAFGGPHDAGSYKQWPYETQFFKDTGSWNSEYGHFFLSWYSNMLECHGDQVLVCSFESSL